VSEDCPECLSLINNGRQHVTVSGFSIQITDHTEQGEVILRNDIIVSHQMYILIYLPVLVHLCDS